MVYPQRYSRRRNHRFDRPEFIVSMNGVNHRSANWSLGGIAVRCQDEEEQDLAPDMAVSGSLGQAARGERYDFEGRVVRVDAGRREVAVEFSKLSSGAIMLFIDEFRDMIGGAA